MTVHPAGKMLPWTLSSLDLKKKPPKTGKTVRFWPLGRCTIFGVGAIVPAHGTASPQGRSCGLVRRSGLLEWTAVCKADVMGLACRRIAFGQRQPTQRWQQVLPYLYPRSGGLVNALVVSRGALLGSRTAFVVVGASRGFGALQMLRIVAGLLLLA